jgi:uncharacterized protein YcfJ
MKRLLSIVTAAVAASVGASALASDVGVSVSVGGPGYYGRVEIGDLPRPRLVYAEPVVIERAPRRRVHAPVYMHVPPGHARNWRKHCHRYDACAQPVYFVQESWYREVYLPPRPIPVDRHAPRAAYAPPPPAVHEYHRPPPRYYEVPVTSVRAVMGAPEQRCWVERREIVDDRRDAPNVPGAIVGAVVGGVIGHQIGGGRGRDVATAGGAVVGAVVGANVGRGTGQVYTQDVQRCATVERHARPEYWDLTYTFGGIEHRVQTTVPPGPTITVDARGEPRG